MPNQNYCPNCGAPLEEGSNVCPHCGSIVGPEPAQNQYQQPQYQQPQYQQPQYQQQPVYQNYGYQPLPAKSKIAAGLLHLLIGGIGVGNFYMGNIGLGIVDILFCWTGIPAIVNFIRGIIILCSSDESFCQKYNVRIE